MFALADSVSLLLMFLTKKPIRRFSLLPASDRFNTLKPISGNVSNYGQHLATNTQRHPTANSQLSVSLVIDSDGCILVYFVAEDATAEGANEEQVFRGERRRVSESQRANLLSGCE